MAADKPDTSITAKDVANFLAGNPDAMSDLLATEPEFLAACLTAAGTHAAAHMDNKVVDLIPALAAKRAKMPAKLARHISRYCMLRLKIC